MLCLVFTLFESRYSIFMISMSSMLKFFENYFIENNIKYNLIKVNKSHSVFKLNNYNQEIILKSLWVLSNVRFKNYNAIEISKILNLFNKD